MRITMAGGRIARRRRVDTYQNCTPITSCVPAMRTLIGTARVGKDEAEEELVPGERERDDAGCDQGRSGERERDAEEDLEGARPVDAGGLLHLDGDAMEGIPHEQHREGHRERGVGGDEDDARVEQVEALSEVEERQDRRGGRQEPLREEVQGDVPVPPAAIAEPRQAVAGERAERHRHQAGAEPDEEAVAEPAEDGGAPVEQLGSPVRQGGSELDPRYERQPEDVDRLLERGDRRPIEGEEDPYGGQDQDRARDDVFEPIAARRDSAESP